MLVANNVITNPLSQILLWEGIKDHLDTMRKVRLITDTESSRILRLITLGESMCGNMCDALVKEGTYPSLRQAEDIKNTIVCARWLEDLIVRGECSIIVTEEVPDEI